MKKTIFAFGALAALFLVSGVGATLSYYSPSAVSSYYTSQGWTSSPWISTTQDSMLHSYSAYDTYGNSAFHYQDGVEAALYGYDYNTCRNGRCAQQTPYFDLGYNYGTALLNQYTPTYTYTTPSYTYDYNYDYTISNSYNTVNSYNVDNSVSSYSYNYGGGGCCYYGYCYC